MLVFKKKLLLKEYEYFLLKECRYPSEQTVLQSTHYYDTQDYRLNKAGITCCIQEQNGRCTAIVRDHRVQWEDCTIENSVSVRSKWDDSFFQNMELRFQGNMETQRTVFVLWPGGKFTWTETVTLAYRIMNSRLHTSTRQGHGLRRRWSLFWTVCLFTEGERRHLHLRKDSAKARANLFAFLRKRQYWTVS